MREIQFFLSSLAWTFGSSSLHSQICLVHHSQHTERRISDEEKEEEKFDTGVERRKKLN